MRIVPVKKLKKKLRFKPLESGMKILRTSSIVTMNAVEQEQKYYMKIDVPIHTEE